MLVSSYTQLKDVLCIKLGKEILTEVLKLFLVYLLRALTLALEPLKSHSVVVVAAQVVERWHSVRAGQVQILGQT